ncbi:MAG: pitrilysin family protein [Candidatus Pacearchaeota archaeon]
MANFTKKVLPNGFTIIHEKRELPITTIMLGVKVGAAYENEKEKGISHFLEHMCFKGTSKRNSKEIAEEIENVGGILNAFTDEEVTAFHAKVPSFHLEKSMEVLFDIFFNPVFPEEEIKKEALVVCEEIKMYDDHPQYFVLNKIKENLYKKPFGLPISGSKENVLSFNRDKLREFHNKYYAPENSILVVVGNNSFEEIFSLVKKFLKNKEKSSFVIPKIIPIIKKREYKRKSVSQANISIGFHFPLSSQKESYAAEVFNTILGEGMSSKLFLEVREKRGLVYTIKSELELGKNFSYLTIFAGTDKKKVNEVIKISLEEFSKISSLNKGDLERAKKQVIGNFLVENEDSANCAMNLLLFEIIRKAEDYYTFEENIKKVSIEDVRKLAENKNYSLVVLEPQ